MMYGWPGMMGFGAFGMIFGFIFFMAVIAGIVFLIVWLVKRVGNTTTDKTGSRSLEILKERYAKGEITKEQYENMAKDLGLK
jgi:putative membrane protein